MNLYACTTYKEALKALVQNIKTKKKSVTFEAMAHHCRVQKTYLSKVLNKEGNLSPDQFHLAVDYLKLNSFDTAFIENLFLCNTTDIPSRKNLYLQKMDKLKKEVLKTESSINSQLESSEQNSTLEKYYLDPLYQLIHIFLTIPDFAKNYLSIAKKLNISNSKLDDYLTHLIDWKIIENKNNIYKVLKTNLHLSKESHLNPAFRNFARMSSQNKMNLSEPDDFYAFSGVISCDENTKQKIQKRFLEFLKQCQNDVIKSESKNVYQINFDLLKWG